MEELRCQSEQVVLVQQGVWAQQATGIFELETEPWTPQAYKKHPWQVANLCELTNRVCSAPKKKDFGRSLP